MGLLQRLFSLPGYIGAVVLASLGLAPADSVRWLSEKISPETLSWISSDKARWTFVLGGVWLLAFTYFRRRRQDPRFETSKLPNNSRRQEIKARTDPRHITAADAIRYIADESEWGERLRASPPDARGMRQQPRFAAIEEFVRAARAGELIVLL
jgi:hypothetical protein